MEVTFGRFPSVFSSLFRTCGLRPDNGCPDLRLRRAGCSMLNSDRPDRDVVDTWARFVQGVLGVLAFLGALAMAHYYAPGRDLELARQVHQLSRQGENLEREQSLSMAAVDDARDSVAYIFGIYHVSGKGRSQNFRARVGGTGFVVAA